MAKKPTYEKLEQRVKELENEALERKQAEEALRGSNERYTALFERALDCIYIHDFEGNFIDANPAALKLFGYTREEILSLNFASLLNQDQMSLALQTLEKVKKDGFQKDITEFKLTAKNGEQIHIETKASLLYHEGEPYAIQGIGRDITARKQSEEALREGQERYRTLVEAANWSGQGIMVLQGTNEVESVCVFANDAAIDITGYTQEELAELSWLRDIIHPLYQDGAVERYKKRMNGESISDIFEISIVRKDGSEVPIELASVDTEFNGKRALVTLFRDTTERKRSEESLREAYNIINRSPAVAFLWKNAEGWPVEFVSDNVAELFGHTAEEFTSGKVSYATTVHPDDLERVAQEVTTYSKEEDRKEFSHDPYRIITKNGEVKWLDDMSSIRRDEKGDITHYEGIVLDITDQKRLEAQLQQAQKMEAIGTLAGGVAHDLNNILGGIVSYPELLLLKLPEDSPLRNFVLTMQKSGEKAAAVVQDLLTLARRGVVITEVVDLNDVVSEYLKSPEYEKLQSFHPGVHIETHLEKDVLNILGSSTHLSKTVMNLISNAAEAMPEGGKLTVSTENRYIDRPIRGYDDVKEGDYVVLTISDTGTGISPDDIEKIFEPFYTKKKMGRSGTGLGMAVVWGTVKDHNGYIDVQSIEGEARPPRLSARDGGQGTTFTLYFPVTRKNLPEDKSHLAIETYRGNGESILIIDDVEEQRQIASGMLKELGYSVVSVSSGEEAVEYLKANKVDLLLLDMIMDPGMDGLDTYKRILEIHPGQKAIIVSGLSETDRVKKVQGLGAGTYIRKPFLLEKIGLAVKEELEK